MKNPNFKELGKGDRVVFLEAYGQVEEGSTGTVVDTGYSNSPVLQTWLVRLDSPTKNGKTITNVYPYRLGKLDQSPVESETEGAVGKVASVYRKAGPHRSLVAVNTLLAEEVGELATEIAIVSGIRHNKQPSSDGVLGEAVDVAIVALDIALLAAFGDEKLVNDKIKEKLAKWSSYL